jgi:hypothetical protein
MTENERLKLRENAYIKHSLRIYGNGPKPIDSITNFYAGWDAAAAALRSTASAEPVAPIGYVSPITLKALQLHAEGHGSIVACAGYATTIPLYAAAPPEPTLRPSGEGELRKALQAAYLELKNHEADYHYRTSIAVNSMIVDALFTAPQAAPEPTREEIALTILKNIYVLNCPMPQVNALEVADAILALTKPRSKT